MLTDQPDLFDAVWLDVAAAATWTLGDGSVVVLVDGKSGGVHLSHIEVLP